MRILLVAMLLTGCGSACSSSSERVPKPADPANAPSPTTAASTGSAKAEPEPPPPPPPPTPLDPEDERVVYISPAPRSAVRFAVHGESLLVADTEGEGERVVLQDLFGREAWSRSYKRVDDLALQEQAAYVVADGELQRVSREPGAEAQVLGEARGQVLLDEQFVYVQHLGKVSRMPLAGGEWQLVAQHEGTAGFHTAAIAGDQLVLLVSAFRNRPARKPKLGWLLTAPASGGELDVRFRDMYSPGPLLRVDSGYAYFGASEEAEEFEYEVMRVQLAGKAPAEVVVHFPIAVFAVSGDAIYAAARLDDAVGMFRFSTCDEEPVLLSAFEGGASSIALTDTHVYWESEGRIYRTSKEGESPARTPEEGEEEAQQGAEAARATKQGQQAAR